MIRNGRFLIFSALIVLASGPPGTVLAQETSEDRLAEVVGIAHAAILFLGDAIFPGGNDYPAKEMGLDTVRVRDVAETKSVITGLVAWLQPSR